MNTGEGIITAVTRKIREYPDEVLTEPARKVGRKDLESVRQLIEDMADTMDEFGGVGLAANQVGESLRVILARDLEHDETHYYLNPTITRGQGEELDEEGCLSFPELVGLIPRYEKVTVKFQDLELNTYKLELEGLDARIVQHEVDHLNGVTIRDRSTVDLYHKKDPSEY